MVKVNVKLKGDVHQKLTAYGKKIMDRIIFTGTAAAANVIYQEVKRNASPPRMGKESGNLARSIYRVYSPEDSPPGVKTYKISWNKTTAPHGHFLEFGTSKMTAKPFLRPAFQIVSLAFNEGKKRMSKRLAEGG